MSKRYGRNQKRRHREQVAALEVSIEELQATVNELQNKVKELQGPWRRATDEPSIDFFTLLHEEIKVVNEFRLHRTTKGKFIRQDRSDRRVYLTVMLNQEFASWYRNNFSATVQWKGMVYQLRSVQAKERMDGYEVDQSVDIELRAFV